MDKFNTCAYRSEQPLQIGVMWCCGNDLHEGYVCYIRDIEDLEPEVCAECPMYVKKNYGSETTENSG